MVIWRNNNAALILILILAALLRVHSLMQIEHNVDHAYPIWQALQTLDRGVFPLAGQGTSVLFANPALTGYLYLPFVGIARSPLAAYALVIALNTLAVLLAYHAVRSIAGAAPALIAAALLAVNPWVIEYSRATWVQSLLPFFTCALAWLLWPVFTEPAAKRTRRLVVALIVLTAFTQTYLLAFVMCATVGLLMLRYWKYLPKRALIIGGGIFLAAGSLYAVGLATQWGTVADRIGNFTSASASLRPDALEHALRLVTGADFAAARGVDAPAGDAELRQTLSQIAHGVGVGLVLVGVARGIGSILTQRRRGAEGNQRGVQLNAHPIALTADGALILLIWFFVPIVLMSYVGQRVHPFYLLLTLPAGAALAGSGMWWMATWIVKQLRGTVSSASLIVLLFLMPFGILMIINSMRYGEETAASPGAHGLLALPLGDGLRLGAAINAHLPQDGLVFAPVEEYILNSFAGRAFTSIWDLRAPDFQIVPQAGGLVIQSHPPRTEIAQTPLTTPAETLMLIDGTTITLEALPRAETITPQTALNLPTAQGITLLGYDLAPADAQWLLTTYWRIDARPAEIDRYTFAPFVHVFNAADENIQIADGAGVAGYLWRVGDVHVHRIRFTAADADSVRVGQYDAGNAANIIFRLSDGTSDATVLLTLP
jgi:hypothetical protein